jgi:hypothetical protein
MESLQSIALGAPPKDPEEGDKRVTNVMKVLELGYPEGVIAVCKICNAVQEFGLDEAAVMIVDHSWPYCCSVRMVMDNPENAPRF